MSERDLTLYLEDILEAIEKFVKEKFSPS